MLTTINTSSTSPIFPIPSPSSASLNEDPNLWLSSHCEFLEKREKEYMALSQELEMLVEIHKDMEKLVVKQQPSLDKTETHITDSFQRTLDSNLALDLAHRFQKSSTLLRAGSVIILGTTLGSGIGGVALLIGVKPFIALTIGGSFGALISSVVASKIE